MISVSGVSYFYTRGEEKISALEGVDLQISKGEFVVFAGHNGSGKSTLARLLNGLLLPAAGTVTVDGLKTSDSQSLWQIRQTVGMVFQSPENQLVAPVVEEDIAFGLENLGLPREEIVRRVREALMRVGLAGYERREPHYLSGGEKQRVAVAGVLAMKPKYLVLDECISHLDSAGRRETLGLLRRIASETDTGLVYITHFLDDVTDADRVVLIKNGRIFASGKPREIISSIDLLSQAGVPVPATVRLAARLRAEGIDVPDNSLTVKELVEAVCSLS